MFRVKRLNIDTLGEHVVFIGERAVEEGNLGFQPLDRVRVFGSDNGMESGPAITGILNFCRGEAIIAPDEIGLSDLAFRDLGLPDGARVNATLAPAPPSVDLVRGKLRGAQAVPTISNSWAWRCTLTTANIVDFRWDRDTMGTSP